MIRKFFITFFLLLVPTISYGKNDTPWMFFDLGKTLINHTRDYSEMRYLPGALNYLKALKRKGYNLGLLLNWPENEGNGNREKLILLKEYIEPRWIDKTPFDWSLFDAVLFPPEDVYRKPHQYLFIEALRTAAPNPVVYQGEDQEEIQVARSLGLTAHCVSDGKGNRIPLILIDNLPQRIRESFIYDYPGN